MTVRHARKRIDSLIAKAAEHVASVGDVDIIGVSGVAALAYLQAQRDALVSDLQAEIATVVRCFADASIATAILTRSLALSWMVPRGMCWGGSWGADDTDLAWRMLDTLGVHMTRWAWPDGVKPHDVSVWASPGWRNVKDEEPFGPLPESDGTMVIGTHRENGRRVRIVPHNLALVYAAEKSVREGLKATHSLSRIDAGGVPQSVVRTMAGVPMLARMSLPMGKMEGARWEIAMPGKGGAQLSLQPVGVPQGITDALKRWGGGEALRQWAALHVMMSKQGAPREMMWFLNDNLDVLGIPSKHRARWRKKIIEATLLLTKIELRLERDDRKKRYSGPLVELGEARIEGRESTADEYAVEGRELRFHKLLYSGVRRSDGRLGSNFSWFASSIATINHQTHAPAIALGMLLPMMWQWRWFDFSEDHYRCTGAKLLELAGITRPGEGWLGYVAQHWHMLETNLEELRKHGGVEGWEWADEPSAEAMCTLYPPGRVADRLIHGLRPEERVVKADAITARTGAELRALRKARGLTQAQAAERIGVSRPAWTKAEAQESDPIPLRFVRSLDRL